MILICFIEFSAAGVAAAFLVPYVPFLIAVSVLATSASIAGLYYGISTTMVAVVAIGGVWVSQLGYIIGVVLIALVASFVGRTKMAVWLLPRSRKDFSK